MKCFLILVFSVLSLKSINCQDTDPKPSASLQDVKSLLDSFTNNFKNITGSFAQSLGVDSSTVQDAQTKLQGLAEDAGKVTQQLAAQNLTGKLFEVFQDFRTKTDSTVQDLMKGKGDDVFGKWVSDTSKTVQDAVQQGQQAVAGMAKPGNGTAFIETSLKQMQDGLEQLKEKVGIKN